MEQRPKRSDEEIRRDVLDALANDARVDESGINVDVVEGTVYLTGVALSAPEKRVAKEVASRIKGVLSVEDEIQVSPLARRPDDEIERDVVRALTRDVWVDASRLQVRVDDGVVYLSGTVEDSTSRSAAEDDAWSVRGVTEVVNDIAVMPSPARLDDDIARDVRQELERNLRIKPKQIHVEVRDGVVHLRGSVSTVSQRWVAEDLARWIPGVVDVINELSFES